MSNNKQYDYNQPYFNNADNDQINQYEPPPPVVYMDDDDINRYHRVEQNRPIAQPAVYNY